MVETKCSRCINLKEGEGKKQFISPQGIYTTIHQGIFYCEADVSRRFTHEQIEEYINCSDFRPRTLTFYQEVKQKIFSFLKQILSKIKININ